MQGKPFKHFFKNYKPNFSNKSGVVGTAIWLLDTIVENLREFCPFIENIVYIAAVKQNIPEKLLDKKYLKEPTNKSHLTHVHGVLRVGYADIKGYILLDFFKKPIVLLEDETVQLNRNIVNESPGTEYPKYVYKLIGKKKNFASCHYYVAPNASAEWVDLIYLGKPYCSFVELTHRYRLLNNEQWINLLAGENVLKAEFYVDLIKKYQHIKVLNDKGYAIKESIDLKTHPRKKFGNSIQKLTAKAFNSTDIKNTIETVDQIMRDDEFIINVIKTAEKIQVPKTKSSLSCSCSTSS